MIAEVALLNREGPMSLLRPGSTFELFEGQRLVAKGEVLFVHDREQSRLGRQKGAIKQPKKRKIEARIDAYEDAVNRAVGSRVCCLHCEWWECDVRASTRNSTSRKYVAGKDFTV